MLLKQPFVNKNIPLQEGALQSVPESLFLRAMNIGVVTNPRSGGNRKDIGESGNSGPKSGNSSRRSGYILGTECGPCRVF